MRERPIILSICPNAGKATTITELVISAGQTFGVIIETTLLRIRPLRDDDLADLVRLIDNWAVGRWLSSVPHPYNEADGRTWIALVRQDHAPFAALCRCAEGDRPPDWRRGLDGSTGDESEEPGLGYWLGQPYWGNGYGRDH
jgi:8-oxo-dGTP diphosphatase